MKNKKVLTISAASLATLIMAGGIAFAAHAQTNTVTDTTFGPRHNYNWTNLSDAQKAQIEANREEMDQQREARQAAMQAAINSGNYDTFVSAVKAQFGDNAPILSKINSDNFPQFVEAHQLMEQARTKFEALGLNRGEGMGVGMGFMAEGHGHGRGFNRTIQNSNNQ